MLRSVNYGSTQSFAGGRVAVMPSFGRIKQFSVLGVAAAVLVGVAAPKASASNDVVLWACSSPAGFMSFNPSSDPAPPLFGMTANTGGVLTFEPGTNQDACHTRGINAATGAVGSSIPSGSKASVQWFVPGGLKIAAVT